MPIRIDLENYTLSIEVPSMRISDIHGPSCYCALCHPAAVLGAFVVGLQEGLRAEPPSPLAVASAELLEAEHREEALLVIQADQEAELLRTKSALERVQNRRRVLNGRVIVLEAEAIRARIPVTGR